MAEKSRWSRFKDGAKKRALQVATVVYMALPARAVAQTHNPLPLPQEPHGATATTDDKHINVDAYAATHYVRSGETARFVWKDASKITIDQEKGEIFYNGQKIVSYQRGALVYGATEKEIADGWGDLPISKAARDQSAFCNPDLPIEFGEKLEGQLEQLTAEMKSQLSHLKRPSEAGHEGSYAYLRQDYNNRRLAEHTLRTFVKEDSRCNAFPWTISRKESGWNPFAVNRLGYRGLGQFGKSALQSVGLMNSAGYTGKFNVWSDEDYLRNLPAQVAALNKLQWQNAAQIPESWVGRSIQYMGSDGQQHSFVTTRANLTAGAHLLGFEGMRQVIEGGDFGKGDADGITFGTYVGLYDHKGGFSCKYVATKKNGQLRCYDESGMVSETKYEGPPDFDGPDGDGHGHSHSSQDHSHDQDGSGMEGAGALGAAVSKLFSSVSSTLLVGAGVVGGMFYLANREEPEKDHTDDAPAPATSKPASAPLAARSNTITTPVSPAATASPSREMASSASSPSRSSSVTRSQPLSYVDRVTAQREKTTAATEKKTAIQWFSPKNLAIVAATAGVGIITYMAVRGSGRGHSSGIS